MNNKLKFLNEGLIFYDELTKNLIKIKLTNTDFTISINHKRYFFILNDEGKCKYDGVCVFNIPEDITVYPTLRELSNCDSNVLNKMKDREMEIFDKFIYKENK